MPPPEPQFNCWSCALACYVWTLKKYGQTADQEGIILAESAKYWEWSSNNRPGLLSRGGLIDLMLQTNVSVRKFLHTDSIADCHEYLHRNHDKYVAGFVLNRRPTNHCMAVVHWDGQHVHVMNPSAKGCFQTIPWATLSEEQDSDFLFFFG